MSHKHHEDWVFPAPRVARRSARSSVTCPEPPVSSRFLFPSMGGGDYGNLRERPQLEVADGTSQPVAGEVNGEDRHPCVLVICDEGEASAQLCGILRLWGMSAYCAATRGEAEMLLKRREYRLILLSSTTQAMDMPGVIRRVRKGGRNSVTPIVVVARGPEVRMALEAGANDALPVFDTVRGVARICLYWLDRRD